MLEDLFLEQSELPMGWRREAEFREACVAAPLDSGCKSVDDLALGFSHKSGHAYENIYVYETVEHAASDFERMIDLVYSGNKYSTPWIVPDELPYVSFVASQSYFACHTHSGEPRCRFLAQYHEFIVELYTKTNNMSYEELEQVLETIDQKMAKFTAQ